MWLLPSSEMVASSLLCVAVTSPPPPCPLPACMGSNAHYFPLPRVLPRPDLLLHTESFRDIYLASVLSPERWRHKLRDKHILWSRKEAFHPNFSLVHHWQNNFHHLSYLARAKSSKRSNVGFERRFILPLTRDRT